MIPVVLFAVSVTLAFTGCVFTIIAVAFFTEAVANKKMLKI